MISDTCWKKLKKRIIYDSVGEESYYGALGYYLRKSNGRDFFQPIEGYAPSRHPWVENMRFLFRKLGYAKLISFLDWCLKWRKAPWRGYLKWFLSQDVPKLPHNNRKEEESIEIAAERTEREKQKKLKDILYVDQSASTLSTFTKRFKIKKKVIQEVKSQLPTPLGHITNQYRRYPIYDLGQLCHSFGIDNSHTLLKRK